MDLTLLLQALPPFTSSPSPIWPPISTNDLLRLFIQAYMEDCHQPAPAPSLIESQENALDRPFKAWNSDLYYGN